MKCFKHQENEASGVCRNCALGLCRECFYDAAADLGVVCSEQCRERVRKVLASFDELEELKPRYEEDRRRYAKLADENELRNAKIMADNDYQKEKNVQLYLNLAGQEKKSFYFCAAIGFSMLGYGGIYAKFLDWYFCFGLGIILLVFAFNAFHRSEAYRKFAAQESF